MKTRVICGISCCVLALCTAAICAQTPGAEAPKSSGGKEHEAPEMAVRIFPIQNTTCTEIAEILNRLQPWDSMVASDANTNSVIIKAAPDSLGKYESLIRELDRKGGANPDSNQRSVTLEIRFRSVRDIESRVKEVLGKGNPKEDNRVASDTARSRLLLRGSNAFVAAAIDLVQSLDMPAESVQVEFAYFLADRDPNVETPPPPPDLTEVAKSLERFGKLNLLGRLTCTVAEDEPVTIQGRLGTGLRARISGAIAKLGADGSVKMSLDADLEMEEPQQQPDPNSKSMQSPVRKTGGFTVKTSIATRRGDTVVIGTAPAGLADGQSVILVMQVRK